jgi:hypothetical protein
MTGPHHPDPESTNGAETAESGQGLAEYALILAFIALVCVAAVGALGTALANSAGFKIF